VRRLGECLEEERRGRGEGCGCGWSKGGVRVRMCICGNATFVVRVEMVGTLLR